MAKTFPMQGRRDDVGIPIPWSIIADHEQQARKNHGQSLEELARRGGLSPCEALAVIEDRPWRRLADGEAEARLGLLIAERLEEAERAETKLSEVVR